MTPASRSPAGPIAAALLGVIAFFLFCGWTVLVPTNIAWLNVGDRAMHQLGWMFFREGPWGLPPGVNPDLGIELSNSIALVDGLPLFALPFKLIGQWLPQPFQYWGYWLLLCFVLQGHFAYRIARELGAASLGALAATGFALIAPAFLYRYPMHMALGGHWVILAGLLLYVRADPPRLWHWPLLLVLTSAIHAYLLAMVLALWAAAWLQRLLLGHLIPRTAGIEALLAVIGVTATLWAAGFFMTGSLGTYGFGDYKLNLLGFFIRDRWSVIFPDLPHTRLDYEGMSFLGIGIMALLVLAVVSGAVLKLHALVQKRWWPLVLMVVLLALFALSNEVAFGDRELFAVWVPSRVMRFFALFRSSGRFVWPLYYLITIGAVALLAQRFRPRTVAALAIVAFAAQAADSAPGLIKFDRGLSRPAATWPSPLVSEFWERVPAAGYTRIRAIPIGGYAGDWKALSYYAVTHGMAVDSVYLGRVDDAALAALKAKNELALATGSFEPETVYEFDVLSALRAAKHLRPGDLLATIDGRIIFARNGARLVLDLGIPPQSGLAD